MKLVPMHGTYVSIASSPGHSHVFNVACNGLGDEAMCVHNYTIQ